METNGKEGLIGNQEIYSYLFFGLANLVQFVRQLDDIVFVTRDDNSRILGSSSIASHSVPLLRGDLSFVFTDNLGHLAVPVAPSPAP